MLIIYNNRPDCRVGNRDCVKRAITKSEGRDYLEIEKELNQKKKETKAKYYNSTENWKKYLEDKGYEKISFPAEAGVPRMNGKRFMEKFKTGTYILRMSKHLTVCVDGDIYDTWDCTDKCVYLAYKKKD